MRVFPAVFVAGVVAAVLAGCASPEPLLENQDVSENGSVLIVPAPVAEVNELVRGLVPEWKLVVARDQATAEEGQFDLSTTTSAATVTTSAAGQGSTRVSVYAGTMVTAAGGGTIHAADPRTILDLQRAIVGRLESTYHVKALGSADSTWERLKKGK
jgi:hypothetical protein